MNGVVTLGGFVFAMEVMVFLCVNLLRRRSAYEGNGIIMDGQAIDLPEGVSHYKTVKTLPINITGTVKEIRNVDGNFSMIGLEIATSDMEKFSIGKFVNVTGTQLVVETLPPDFVPESGHSTMESVKSVVKSMLPGKGKQDEELNAEIKKAVQEFAEDENEQMEEKPPIDIKPTGPSEAHTIPKITDEQLKEKMSQTTKSWTQKQIDMGKMRAYCSKCPKRNWGWPPKEGEKFVCDSCKKKEANGEKK